MFETKAFSLMGDEKISLISDSQLWNAFLKGDEMAYMMIYKTQVQALFKYGLKFTPDEGLVQDAIHDLFVDLQKYRKKLSATDNIRYYLFKSLRNRILYLVSSEAAKQPFDINETAFNFGDDWIDDPEDQEQERLKQVHNAISALSDRQKEALYLKFNAGLEYDEISNLLQINYQSARNLVFRALEKLRELCRNKSIVLFFSFSEYKKWTFHFKRKQMNNSNN